MLPMQNHPAPLHHQRAGPPFMMPQTLQRGSACLTCRKRKLKCDAGRPACSQCVRSSKECSYDDGKTRTRTQKLQDRITELEDQIKEMQNHGIPVPPHRTKSSNSRSASESSPNDASHLNASPGISPRAHASMGSAQLSSNGAGSSTASLLTHPPPHVSSPPHGYYGQPPLPANGIGGPWSQPSIYRQSEPAGAYWETELLPPPMQQHLLDLCIAHRRSFHFEFDVDRFLDRLHGPPHLQPHPALLNAMWLLGSHYSDSSPFPDREALLLSRTRQGILDSLAQSDRLLQCLQAQALVATYLFLKGHFLEAYHHSCSAAHFAAACGVHQITSHSLKDNTQTDPTNATDNTSPWSGSGGFSSSGMLGPPQDAVEVGERILTFWMIYLLDKTISITAGLPSGFASEEDVLNRPTTAWPRPLENYGMGVLQDYNDASIPELYNSQPNSPRYARTQADTLFTLRVKSQALLDRATRLSYSLNTAHASTQTFRDSFQAADEAIERFLRNSLPPLRSTEDRGEITSSPGGPINLLAFTIHTIGHGAMIQLHTANASANSISYDKCLYAARACVDLIGQAQIFGNTPFPTDSTLGHCWTAVAQVLIRQAGWLRKNNKLSEAAEIETDVTGVLSVVQRLAVAFPLLDFQVKKIHDLRAIPEALAV